MNSYVAEFLARRFYSRMVNHINFKLGRLGSHSSFAIISGVGKEGRLVSSLSLSFPAFKVERIIPFPAC